MIAIAAALLGLALLGFVLYLRTLADTPEPVYLIEQDIEIAADQEVVWDVLSDVASYPEWNPYVLGIEGELTPGSTIALTISQDDWPEPLTVHPTMKVVDAPGELGWHGSVIVRGFLETDHYFQLTTIAPGRTRLHHAEEFRGWLAHRMNEEERHAHTRRAFRAMNEALAARAEARQAAAPSE